MNEIGRIVDRLKEIHEGGAWHGPSVKDALEGVTAAAAARKPLGAGHSNWEIVHHIRVTDENVRARLSGETAPAEDDWPTLKDTSEAAWKKAVSGLEAAQRGLRTAASKLSDERLQETVPGQESTYWYLLHGIMNHDLYHTGQISLLKKGL